MFVLKIFTDNLFENFLLELLNHNQKKFTSCEIFYFVLFEPGSKMSVHQLAHSLLQLIVVLIGSLSP